MEYLGTMSVTETGKSCLTWDSKQVASSYESIPAGFTEILFFEEHFLNQDPSFHENYCRNPTGLEKPWCFVNDNDLQMEFCWIPQCNDFSVPECKLTQKGGEYMGTKDKTISGFHCIPWLDHDSSVVDRIRGSRKGSLPDELTGSHNFCRNPNGYPGGPWCNVRDSGRPNLKCEYCDVPFCDFHDSKRTRESQDQHLSSEPAKETRDHSNFCRNYGPRLRPWCLVTVEDATWEYCRIPLCRGPKEPAECQQTKHGREYSGLKNVTRSGKKCQPWLSQTPNEHSTILYLPAFPDPGLDSRHNYCRNPDVVKEGPWCYNGEGTNPEWEYCDIQLC
ncbi:unnamed protein product [Darwinula stevensoni]|uniref:Kringle domain-containing protein n=1 Tax=Darwinula stevensoni TaxID=69355 RepID=A0A7R8XEQ6_9CRUS|nr:unnamed protein product [Darwinula stevensoni]CAG0890884.1 unnamed protein product [Darwinula stevensoni]